jgi:hypothetical protein
MRMLILFYLTELSNIDTLITNSRLSFPNIGLEISSHVWHISHSTGANLLGNRELQLTHLVLANKWQCSFKQSALNRMYERTRSDRLSPIDRFIRLYVLEVCEGNLEHIDQLRSELVHTRVRIHPTLSDDEQPFVHDMLHDSLVSNSTLRFICAHPFKKLDNSTIVQPPSNQELADLQESLHQLENRYDELKGQYDRLSNDYHEQSVKYIDAMTENERLHTFWKRQMLDQQQYWERQVELNETGRKRQKTDHVQKSM